MKVTKQNSKKYTWGNKCFGWHLLNSPSLSVIQETMPAGTQEALHLHNKSQQFFYILKGRATFKIDGEEHTINAGEGIHISTGKIHQIANKHQAELEFLVISEPHAHGDRESK